MRRLLLALAVSVLAGCETVSPGSGAGTCALTEPGKSPPGQWLLTRQCLCDDPGAGQRLHARAPGAGEPGERLASVLLATCPDRQPSGADLETVHSLSREYQWTDDQLALLALIGDYMKRVLYLRGELREVQGTLDATIKGIHDIESDMNERSNQVLD